MAFKKIAVPQSAIGDCAFITKDHKSQIEEAGHSHEVSNHSLHFVIT